MKKERVKMSKDIVPEGFSLALALVDFVPVCLCCVSCLVIGFQLKNRLFILAAVMILLSGFIKVLWKIIVALQRKNIWWMFLQMRIIMPLGFLLAIISLFFNPTPISFIGFWNGFTKMPSMIFFILGIIGMCLMGVFAKKLDSSDPKSNWIEQITNSIAQAAILIGLLLL